MPNENESLQQTTNRNVQIFCSSPHELSVREMDWQRIYRKIKSVPLDSSIYQTVASTLAGISGSAGLSLIPLYQAAASVDPWVKPAFWLVFLGCGIVAFIVKRFDSEKKAYISSSVSEVAKDMEEVYSTIFPNKKMLE